MRGDDKKGWRWREAVRVRVEEIAWPKVGIKADSSLKSYRTPAG